MDLVQIRLEILNRNVTPMEKARILGGEGCLKTQQVTVGLFHFPLAQRG